MRAVVCLLKQRSAVQGFNFAIVSGFLGQLLLVVNIGCLILLKFLEIMLVVVNRDCATPGIRLFVHIYVFTCDFDAYYDVVVAGAACQSYSVTYC